MTPNILRKRLLKPLKWIKTDREFIEVVKQYGPIDDRKFSRVHEIWQEISKKVNLPAPYCRRKWLRIKLNYFKLKNMIHIGRVTEDMVRLHAKTSKYLDGSLDFLDPYIFEIPDSNLPGSVHQFFDSAFGANTSSHMNSFVDAEKLIIVKENSYLEVIKDYKMETGTEPTSILPNIENEDSDSEKQPLFDLGPNETINNDLIVEYDPHDVLFLEVTNDTSILDNVETIATASTNSLEEIIAKNNEEKRPPINLARFLVKYSKTAETDEQTIDLKEYMNDLAELLCNRMEPEKRKLFLCQVDLMVSELLEGT